MKAKTIIAILLLSAVALCAQQAPSTAGKAGAAVQKQAQTAAKPADSKPKSDAVKTETKSEVKAEASDNDRVRTVGKRDPFVSPVVQQRQLQSQLVACGSGKKCLIIDQINLQGVVKSANGNIAVVTNSAKRAYFLRENDGLYNGRVQRIT